MENIVITKKALEVCFAHNIEDYPVNIIKVATDLDIKVFTQDLRKEFSGYIIIQKDMLVHYKTNRLIVVNSNDDPRRQRFTIAHELGHYFIHKDENDEVYAHRDVGQNDKTEQEANQFAGNILMPEYLLEDALLKYNNRTVYKNSLITKTVYISKLFGVSQAAANITLRNLKLI